MPKHKVKLHYQLQAVIRAVDILQEIYPARILQKKASNRGAEVHIEYLQAVMETIDGLAERRDMREDL